MALSLPDMLALVAQCAPAVAPETLLSIVQVESRFNPLAIGVNGTPRLSASASSHDDAVAKATALIARGRSVDLGLAQINSANLRWLGLTVRDAFDPCANLAAAARVLQDGYERSDAPRIGAQAALRTALSYYNTGKATGGFTNGYVARVVNAASQVVPAINARADASLSVRTEPPPSAQEDAARPPWDVFGDASSRSPLLVTSKESAHDPGQ